MNQVLYSVEEVKRKIAAGERLLLAGDESLLGQLPQGDWIAGTIPYFIAENGGVTTCKKIFVTALPAFVEGASIRVYDEDALPGVYRDIPENGFAVIILPSGSRIHMSFALKATEYPEFATRPLVGWVSGVHLSDLGKRKPKVFNGPSAQVLENRAVVMHVSLPDNKSAQLDILNIFEQGAGDTIVFLQNGFEAKEAQVNGEHRLLAEYIDEESISPQVPLVADYHGVSINISFQRLDSGTGTLTFYAPVFSGVEYRRAREVGDYVSEFTRRLPTRTGNILFSCNCILNYIYSKLEGKRTGDITGPITFGEIAYQLLNQTMVYLTINDSTDPSR
jgi:hypothetical protein